MKAVSRVVKFVHKAGQANGNGQAGFLHYLAFEIVMKRCAALYPATGGAPKRTLVPRIGIYNQKTIPVHQDGAGGEAWWRHTATHTAWIEAGKSQPFARQRNVYGVLMRYIIPLLIALALPQSATAGGCVVLLHGLARSEASMLVMSTVLEQSGYVIVNEGYSSTQQSIGSLKSIVRRSADRCPDGAIRHFVTHSMGGILLRAALEDAPIEGMGRTVMLAPPNGGSALVDALREWSLFEEVNGPAGLQLGTGTESVPLGLGDVLSPNFGEVGIVAGNFSFNPVFSSIIPGDDDGKVSVAETRISGMKDHLVLSVSHTLIAANPLVIAQVKNFLAKGHFEPGLSYSDIIFPD
jgi:triacylglycerol lipase